MAKNGFSTVISIQPQDNAFAFYSAVGRDKDSLKYSVKNYRSRYFDEEFFAEFARCLGEYAAANPSYAGKSAFVTVLLPNAQIATDSFNIPGTNRKNVDSLFKVSTEVTYSNLAELKMNQLTVKQNKQYSTIAVSLIRQKTVQDIYTACSGSNMFANILSSVTSAAVCGAASLNPKLKSETALLLDIKEKSTMMAFTNKGVMLGGFDLPFGWDILHSAKPVAENMLFNHDVAELAVLNAKEKAKAKQLTMMGGGEQPPEGAEGGEENVSLTLDPTTQQAARQINTTIKTLPRKTPRVLPKWMQRPLPETPEGVAYENFRIFMKYALEFLRANRRLTEIAQAETVYVNFPAEFEYLIDMANGEEEENKIKFASLGLKKEKSIITEHLELYGGLFADQFGSLNNF